MNVPILETDLLRLRGHTLGDFSAYLAVRSDPIVSRFTGGKPLTAEDVWNRVLRYRGHWELLGYGLWAVEEKASGEFVGEVGFADFKRGIDHDYVNYPEAAWLFSPRVHGRGYASEALKAALRWMDARQAFQQTFCIIHPDNLASLRVAAKNGYIPAGNTTFKNEPAMLLTRRS